jgi:uncharacterized protein YdeI (YjbR/CyaY-like superfamily)
MAMAGIDQAPVAEVRSRSELRNWLAANHDRSGSVWLATFKKHHADYVAYEAIVEELLCWGWIDGVARALDADRTMHLISQRKASSAWSAINKQHIDRARAAGAMTPAGEARIAVAITNGTWTFLDDVERLEVPDDLTQALVGAAARAGWDAYPRSVKRASLEWLKTARSDATRSVRLADIATSAANGLRPRPFRRKTAAAG